MTDKLENNPPRPDRDCANCRYKMDNGDCTQFDCNFAPKKYVIAEVQEWISNLSKGIERKPFTVKVQTKGSPMAHCYFSCFDISVHDDGKCVVWATDTDGKAYSEEFTSGSYLSAVECNMDAMTFYKEHMGSDLEREFDGM